MDNTPPGGAKSRKHGPSGSVAWPLVHAHFRSPPQLFSFTLTLPYVAITLETLCEGSPWAAQHVLQEKEAVTKKEIVKQISERIGLTQLKTKEIVQLTF